MDKAQMLADLLLANAQGLRQDRNEQGVRMNRLALVGALRSGRPIGLEPDSNAFVNTAAPSPNYWNAMAQNTNRETKEVKSSANEEAMFQNWIRGTDWFKEFVGDYGEEPDLDTEDYDYRAAWRAGIVPERDPYDKNRFHWPSSLPSGQMLKSKDHPTAWKEYFMRDTGINPDALGIKTPEDANTYLKNRR